jgi:hypothetical protein
MRELAPARRGVLVLILAACLVTAIGACGGGGGSSGQKTTDATTPLVVVGFSHANRTDVYRDQSITLVFNATVDPDTVSNRTIQVRTGPNQSTEAPGSYEIDGNRVTFDPQWAEVDLRGTKLVNPNPYGWEPVASYQVLVVGPPLAKRVTNLSGRGVMDEFFTSFRTTEQYTPRFERPRFSNLSFLPVQDPTQPVEQDSQIVFEFEGPKSADESLSVTAIDPATMDPGITVVIEKTLVDDDGNYIDLNGQGNPIWSPVTGTFRGSTDGLRWAFESSFGVGGGPYEVRCHVTTGIQNLVGNPLENPQTVTFRTAFEPNVPNNDSVFEQFSTSLNRDTANTTAEWNGVRRGWLVGGDITTTPRTIQIDMPGGTRTLIQPPLTDQANGSHTQLLYMNDELISEVRTVTEVAWGPENNALFAATYPRILIKLGHYTAENLTNTYADNFNVDAAVRVYDGTYVVPQKANINPPGLDDGFFPYPTFTSYFDYNGQHNLVLDLDVQQGNNWQSHRVFYGITPANPNNPVIPNRRLWGDYQATEGTPITWFPPPTNPEPTAYDMRVTFRRRVTVGQSTWYDARRSSTHWATPIISPPAQPGGATFILEFEGAKGMENPNNPNQIIRDPSTDTGWVESLNLLDGYRFIRFRFTMIANVNSDTVPEINSLMLPYTY